MTYTEEAITFLCEGDRLLGILTKPEAPATSAVVVVVGGPSYRTGSHRQFVLLARALASAGHAVLRFDYRGMGDSEGQPRDFQSVTADIGAAIDTLRQQVPAVNRVVLWGLCDAASACLLYTQETQDRRVAALCLLNPWVRSEAGLARTHVKHYYHRRIMEPEFWRKLLRGQVAGQALRGLAGNLRLALQASRAGHATPVPGQHAPPFQQRMAAAWRAFPGRIVLLLSGEDLTAREFVEYAESDAAWRGAWGRADLVRHDLHGADHTFSIEGHRALVEKLTLAALAETRRPDDTGCFRPAQTAP